MYKIILYIVIGFVLIFGYVKYIEFKGVFFPSREILYKPDSINLAFEDVYIKTSDNLTLNSWFIPYPNAKYTLLFLHGNAGNIGDRLEKINLLRQVGLNIFIIDYRGYGASQGRPSEQGFFQDANTAYEYLLNVRKISPQQIIVFGESLGTAVTVNLASESDVKAVILEGAFSSGRDMAKAVYPYLPNFLFSNKFDSLSRIKKITAPKLFIHSPDDEMVPIKLAQRLFQQADGPKEFLNINGNHNNAFFDSSEICIAAISEFIKDIL